MNAVGSFLGFSDPNARSVMILSTFRGDRGSVRPTVGKFRGANPAQTLRVAKKQNGFRYATAFGDLMAAQQLQRLCIESNLRAPILSGDRTSGFDWEQPPNPSEMPPHVDFDPPYEHAFVVGLVSNSQFVRLYNSHLKDIVELSLLEGEDEHDHDSLVFGLPEDRNGNCLRYYGPTGDVMPHDVLKGCVVAEAGGFIIYARVRFGMNTYFVLGGDTENWTFFSGVYFRRFWPFLLRLLDDVPPEEDFLVALRVASIHENFEAEWPSVMPLLTWRQGGWKLLPHFQ